MRSLLSRLFKTADPTAVKAGTLVDVRSYGGIKNHIVDYTNYGHPFTTGDNQERAALCGYTEWLDRGPLTATSPWLLDSSKTVTKEHYCASCVTLYNNKM